MLRIENMSISNGRLTINAVHCEEIFSSKDVEPAAVDAYYRLEIDFGNGDPIVPMAIPKKLSKDFNPPVEAFISVNKDQWTRFPEHITDITMSTLEIVKNDGITVFSDYRNIIATANHFHMYRIVGVNAEM